MRWALITVLIVALILVPFFLFEDYFNALAARIDAGGTARWSAAAAVIALLASDVVLPIPSSVVSAMAGALLGFARGTLIVWIGMMVSCVVGYLAGHHSSRAARRFVGDDGLRRASGLADRYGSFALVLCRPVPVLAEASVIFAGLVGAPFARFLALCSASNLGVAAGYAAIGAFSMRADSFLLAFFGSLLVPGVAILAAKVWLGQRSAGG
jgi:uncharacterized membrane protein YdjX (TVP38/TMEM64 family)